MGRTAFERFKNIDRAEMNRAFKLVENKEHWKGEIDALIDPNEMKSVADAIVFFTATEATFKFEGDKLRVKADGYWKGPAN